MAMPMGNGRFDVVEASAFNYGITSTIGDFQISLDNKTSNYPQHAVTCHISSCTTTCIHPDTGIVKHRRMSERSKPIEDIKLHANGMVELSYPMMATATLMLGNMDFQSLNVEPARCNLHIERVYGCTGCSMSPYVVFRATENNS